jgi:glycosyltransferase involved in cell wall biosynthesis
VRIAVVGTRGIPSNYGGFETFAEELAVRLVARGHDVTVYGRSHYVPRTLRDYRGVRLVVLPTLRHKYLDTVVHTALSVCHTLAGRYDVVLVCNAANALFCGLPRLVGARVALNVDGLERQRRKWNAFGRAWYRVSERLATILPDAVVTDARVIERYYAERYGTATSFIPYGADLPVPAGTGTLDRFGLVPGEYVLYVSRLEPENNALAVIEGFQKSKLNKKLAVVGDAPYAREYIARLRNAAGPRVVFTGGVYGDGYRELQSHAFVYVHATEVGGTHPALVEAMGFGNCVLVNDVPENREVAGESALYFHATAPETLAALLDRVAADPALRERVAAGARERARSAFSWNMVTDRYETLFRRLRGEAPA